MLVRERERGRDGTRAKREREAQRKTERQRRLVVMTPSLPGNALMPLIGGAISYFFGWQSLFFAMGLLCISAGSASLYYLHYREQQSTPRSPKKGKKRPVTFSEVFENLYRNIFSNRVLWLLSSAYFFVYVIRSALSDWSVMYFVEHKGNPLCRSSLFRYSLSLSHIDLFPFG